MQGPLSLSVALTLSTTLLGGLVSAQQAAPQESPAVSNGLRRVTLDPQNGRQQGGLHRRPPGEAASQQPVFERLDWERKLLEPDLAQRERDFDALLETARRDPAARAYLEECAAAEGELAWTARLGLRELARSRSSNQSLPFAAPESPWGLDQSFPGTPLDANVRDLMQELERAFAELGAGRSLPGTWSPGLQAIAPPAGGATSSQAQSFSMSMGPDGVKLEVQEEVDGQRESRTYEAPSMEELLRQNPELKDKIGIGGSMLRSAPDAGQNVPWRAQRLAPSIQPLQTQTPQPLGTPGTLRTDVLGVYTGTLSSERRHELGLEENLGVLVDQIMLGTIASLLGISSGDVVVEINGQPIHQPDEIGALLRARGDRDELRVSWLDSWGEKRTRTWRPGGIGSGETREE